MNILFPFYLFLVFHELVTAGDTDEPLLPFIPRDNIALDCGSSGINPAYDNRIWEGDTNSKHFPLQAQNGASITSTAVHPPISPVPYQTARLSLSEFTYTFPVTPGQKFIRLHFYPDIYGNFDSSKAFFSVKAANYTLLSNFSAFLRVDALDGRGIVKEFCLNVKKDMVLLSIAFIPDLSSSSDSFAFVNGIEVLSMPTDLYHSSKERGGAKFIGQSEPYTIGEDTALEMMYRINVGGKLISPAEDVASLFRSWGEENDYLVIPGYSVLPVELSHKLSFKVIPPYTAPSNVYLTARSMGNKDKAKIRSYNLTWEFPVDSRFYYLLRLHFCEIESVMNKTGDRVFLIYLANQTAEEAADVMYWSGGYKYVPVYKDYVFAMFGKAGEKKVNLSVALRANPYDWRTSYIDAILNGIEIFKLNDTNGNLAGPNPDNLRTTLPVTQPDELHTQGKNGRKRLIGIISGVILSGVLLLSVIGFYIFSRGRKVKNVGSFEVASTSWGPVSISMTESTKTRGPSLPSHFSHSQLR